MPSKEKTAKRKDRSLTSALTQAISCQLNLRSIRDIVEEIKVEFGIDCFDALNNLLSVTLQKLKNCHTIEQKVFAFVEALQAFQPNKEPNPPCQPKCHVVPVHSCLPYISFSIKRTVFCHSYVSSCQVTAKCEESGLARQISLVDILASPPGSMHMLASCDLAIWLHIRHPCHYSTKLLFQCFVIFDDGKPALRAWKANFTDLAWT